MRILALDYDGVIADSKFECLAVGFNTYLNFESKTKLFDGERFTYENFKNKIETNKGLIKKYKSLRPYVIDAFCFYVIFYALENNIEIKNKSDYDNLRKKLIGLYEQYIKCYYPERSNFQKKINEWLKLLSPYKVTDAIKKLGEKYILTIATNNREKSIKPFLDKYEIPVKVIADSTISTNKVKQIEFIKNKYNAEFSDIYFVDDQVAHFAALLKLNVKCFMAAWGYNTKEQRKDAENIGVVPVSEKSFYKKLDYH